MRQGQYYYRPHRSMWGIWQNQNLGGGVSTGTFIKDLPTKEEAEKEVYRLNDWKPKNVQ